MLNKLFPYPEKKISDPCDLYFNPTRLLTEKEAVIDLSAEHNFLYKRGSLVIEGAVNPHRAHTIGGDYILVLPAGSSTVVFHCDTQGHGYKTALRGKIIQEKMIEIINDLDHPVPTPAELAKKLLIALRTAHKNGEIDLEDSQWQGQLFVGTIMVITENNNKIHIQTAGNSAGETALLKEKNEYQEETASNLSILNIDPEEFLILNKYKPREYVLSAGKEFSSFSDGIDFLSNNELHEAIKKDIYSLSSTNDHDDFSFVKIRFAKSEDCPHYIKGRKANLKHEEEVVDKREKAHFEMIRSLYALFSEFSKSKNKNNADRNFINQFITNKEYELKEVFLGNKILASLLKEKITHALNITHVEDHLLAAVFIYLLGLYAKYYTAIQREVLDSYFLEIITEKDIEDAYKKVSAIANSKSA